MKQVTFQKVENKKFVKTWKKAIVQRVLVTTTYQVQYVFPNGSLGTSSIVHHNRIKAQISGLMSNARLNGESKEER